MRRRRSGRGGFRSIAGNTACVAWTTPMKLTSIIRWNNAASERPKGADSAAPALAIRMSIGCRAAAAAIADLTEAPSATSATSANCAAPDAMASSSVARLRPSTVTTAPASDSACDIARPMPRPPPVTSAWEERDNWDIGQASWSEGSGYILNFKLLQGSGVRSPDERISGWDAPSCGAGPEPLRHSLASRRCILDASSAWVSRCARPGMTTNAFAFSRHVLPEVCIFRRPSKQRAQGRPGARCTRGLVCNCAQKTRTRAYRFSGNIPAFPAQWLYGL